MGEKSCATVFFTFSYADNHWNDLHKLMPGGFSSDKKIRYQNVLDNPHIVDWYFSYRLNEFLKVVFDGILECEWRWHRFEWQSRSSIHAHGAAKFKNDPGLIKLTNNVYLGRKALEKIETVNNEEDKIKLKNIIDIGIQSETTVINYTDTILTAINPRTDDIPSDIVDEVHICSKSYLEINEEDKDKDYEEIINCCQRHVCRSEGYCKSAKGGCRFGYPIEKVEKTYIEFKETVNSVKANIHIKRNDEMMNIHNRIVAHNWRGNVDMQIILDQQACINYMVKYVTKGFFRYTY